MIVKNIPFFWKIYAIIIVLFIVIISITEVVLEPIAKNILNKIYGNFLPWHEIILWAMGIIIPSLVCGYIVSKLLTNKLEKISKASKELANGNLATRLPITSNNKDAFTILSHSFNNMAGAIQQQISKERRLLADISHELRSPLTRMTLAVELLQRNQRLHNNSHIIRLEKEINHMGELISHLLTQSKEKMTLPQQLETVDINLLLTTLTADYNFQGAMQNKQINSILDTGLIMHGQPLMLQRMFENILSNALFYAPENSQIDIHACLLHDNTIQVCIRDYGFGVPTEQLTDIFRAFYRVDDSRARQNGGVGLGLTIVKETVLNHNGTIKAHNALPGLEIIIILPGL